MCRLGEPGKIREHDAQHFDLVGDALFPTRRQTRCNRLRHDRRDRTEAPGDGPPRLLGGGQELLARLIGYFPPLADFFSASLDGVVSARGALSIIGLVGLLWGASNFYAGLDEVMRRIFPGGMVRGPVDRRVRGLITVVGLLLLLVGTVLLSSVWALVNQLVGQFAVWSYVVPIISLAVFVAVVLIIYLLVPTAPPSFRAALPAALVAGVGIGLLTNLFGVLAPWLIGGLSAFGVIATAFGVLISLNFSYQSLLYGAAWARLRRDREKHAVSVDDAMARTVEAVRTG